MEVYESINLSKYVYILKNNDYKSEKIKELKEEYINYIYGKRDSTISPELEWYLNYLEKEKQGKKNNR